MHANQQQFAKNERKFATHLMTMINRDTLSMAVRIQCSSKVILPIVPRRYFCCDSICFMFGGDFLCWFNQMNVFIVLIKFG